MLDFLKIISIEGVVKRRALGVLFLVLALGMLVAGETVLQDKLSSSLFVLYWLACFVFTMLAMIVALRDLRALQSKARKEQRGLLDDTIEKIVTDAKAKQRRNGGAKGGTDRRRHAWLASARSVQEQGSALFRRALEEEGWQDRRQVIAALG